MIDIESTIFDTVAKAVMAEFPDIVATSVDVAAPADFPAIQLYEANRETDDSRIDNSGIEKGAVLYYDVNVYTNLRVGAKSQAKKIVAVVDDLLYAMNFTKTYTSQGFMPGGSSIYRVTLRYTTCVDSNGKLYRRS